MRYDPSIIEKYARRMHRHADLVVFAWSMIGLFIGGGVCVPLAALSSPLAAQWPFFAVGGLLLGLLSGRSRALELRLKAEMALCQMNIELNTRATALASGVQLERVAAAQPAA